MKPKIRHRSPATKPQKASTLAAGGRLYWERDSMRRRAFVHLAAFFVASLAFGSPAFAADDIRVSGPIVHDNIAIYLLHGSAAGGAAAPVTLQEALAKGSVKVDETGSVNELTVENLGNDEVFVQAGDIVKGGRQDRVLSVDLLLPPHSGQVSVAAFCVEHGRWSARGDEDAGLFSGAPNAMPSQEACGRRRYRTESTDHLVDCKEDAGATDTLRRRAHGCAGLAVEPGALTGE
jgi:hypothetical protein